MADLHKAFELHPHVKKLWLDEATGDWHIHPKKGYACLERSGEIELKEVEPKEIQPKKKKKK